MRHPRQTQHQTPPTSRPPPYPSSGPPARKPPPGRNDRGVSAILKEVTPASYNPVKCWNDLCRVRAEIYTRFQYLMTQKEKTKFNQGAKNLSQFLISCLQQDSYLPLFVGLAYEIHSKIAHRVTEFQKSSWGMAGRIYDYATGSGRQKTIFKEKVDELYSQMRRSTMRVVAGVDGGSPAGLTAVRSSVSRLGLSDHIACTTYFNIFVDDFLLQLYREASDAKDKLPVFGTILFVASLRPAQSSSRSAQPASFFSAREPSWPHLLTPTGNRYRSGNTEKTLVGLIGESLRRWRVFYDPPPAKLLLCLFKHFDRLASEDAQGEVMVLYHLLQLLNNAQITLSREQQQEFVNALIRGPHTRLKKRGGEALTPMPTLQNWKDTSFRSSEELPATVILSFFFYRIQSESNIFFRFFFLFLYTQVRTL